MNHQTLEQVFIEHEHMFTSKADFLRFFTAVQAVMAPQEAPKASVADGMMTAEELRILVNNYVTGRENIVDAVKAVRIRTGLSLRESKDIVDSYRGALRGYMGLR